MAKMYLLENQVIAKANVKGYLLPCKQSLFTL